jgi:hypothetical protein
MSKSSPQSVTRVLNPSDKLNLRPSKMRSKSWHEATGHGDANGIHTHARRGGAHRDGAAAHEPVTPLLHIWPK